MNTVQGSDAWFAARKAFDVTGSELSAVLGIDPHKTANALMRTKLSNEKQSGETIAMRYGKAFEETAREMFEAVTGLEVTHTGVCEIPEIDGVKLGSSPDGVAADTSFVLEIKCKIGGNLPSTVEIHHVMQGLAHMEATKAPICYFFYYTNFNGHERGRLFTMHRNTWLFKNAVKSWIKPFVKQMKYYSSLTSRPTVIISSKQKAEVRRILRNHVVIKPGINNS